jgi:ferredoxin, 2Fe-2S
MPQVRFIDVNGSEVVVDAEAGRSLMEAAVAANVAGIAAECGGGCSCATCHVRLGPEWIEIVGGPGDLEIQMLEFAPGFGEGSRLSCQITISESIDGMLAVVVGDK